MGCAYSQADTECFRLNSKRGYQFAAQAFQTALISGFCSNYVDVTVLSFPALSTFPFGYKKPIVRGHDFIYDNKNIGKSLSILNLPFCNYPKQLEYKPFISRWLKNCHDRQKAVVVYGINPPLMRMARFVKTLATGIPIILIAPDLPEYMNYNPFYTKLGLRHRKISKSYQEIKQFDGYVLLTDSMKDRMGFGSKPYSVVEGIYQDIPSLGTERDKRSSQKFRVLYSGALSKRYGIPTLLDAFTMIESAEVELLLCGNGDAVPDITNFSKTDNRISYLGILPMNEVRQLQKDVNLLINPRSSEEIFTQYSFPSKTMEYMASGTPTLMSKLKCLPPEYYPHLFFFEDETACGIKEGIERVYHTADTILEQFGKEAASFIKNEKNEKNQTLKIIELINQILNKNVSI